MLRTPAVQTWGARCEGKGGKLHEVVMHALQPLPLQRVTRGEQQLACLLALGSILILLIAAAVLAAATLMLMLALLLLRLPLLLLLWQQLRFIIGLIVCPAK